MERNMEQTENTENKEYSIQEIADMAGVSKATVSRVINHHADVAPATRERVERIMRERHYTPSLRAQAFSQRKNRTVALVFSNDEAFTLSNPYYAELIQGILEKARETGYHVTLSYFLEDDCIRLVRQRGCDGVLVLTPDATHRKKLRELMKLGYPVVSTAPVEGMPELRSVTVDDYHAACKIIEHLLALGHRRIGMINGPRALYSSAERLRGYREALEKHGCSFSDRLVTYGDTTAESGRENMRLLMARDPALTAAFICSDMMALGARDALESAGLRVPEDVSLVSSDATAIASCLDAPLTALKQPTKRRGELAMAMLVDVIEGREAPESIVLPMDIVVRKTSAAPAERRRDREA